VDDIPANNSETADIAEYCTISPFVCHINGVNDTCQTEDKDSTVDFLYPNFRRGR